MKKHKLSLKNADNIDSELDVSRISSNDKRKAFIELTLDEKSIEDFMQGVGTITPYEITKMDKSFYSFRIINEDLFDEIFNFEGVSYENVDDNMFLNPYENFTIIFSLSVKIHLKRPNLYGKTEEELTIQWKFK